MPFVAGRVVTCLHLRILLPFSAHTEVATEVVLDSPAVSHISRVLFSANDTAQLTLPPIEAEPPENRELVREREGTDRGKVPSIRFNISRRTAGTAGFYFAEVAVTELRCKVSVDLIATKNLVGGVFVVARDPGASYTCAAVLRLRLANTAAEVPAGLAACLRDAHCRSRHYSGAQHCCH